MGQATLTAPVAKSMSEVLDDAQLLKQVAARDKAAFETFYRRYYQRVSQFVGRLVREPQLGEEIVDDTLLAVWNSAKNFAGRSKVSTWVLGIAYRRAMKTLDKECKHRVADHDDDLINEQVDWDSSHDPVAMARADDMSRQLQAGLARLHRDQRIALQLTAMGHSYPEISEIVGCPANTVKTRVFKARSRLRSFIAGAGSLQEGN